MSDSGDGRPRTMFEKIWDDHVVHAEDGKQTILYIDLQLVHEVTSPQAFEGFPPRPEFVFTATFRETVVLQFRSKLFDIGWTDFEGVHS